MVNINNNQYDKKKMFKKFFIIIFLSFITTFIIQYFSTAKTVEDTTNKEPELEYCSYQIVFDKDKDQINKEEFEKKIVALRDYLISLDLNNSLTETDKQTLQEKLKEINIFEFGINKNNKSFFISNINEENLSQYKKYRKKGIIQYINEIIQKKESFFCIKGNVISKDKKENFIKDFFNIKTGTQYSYIEKKYTSNKVPPLEICSFSSDQDIKRLKIDEKEQIYGDVEGKSLIDLTKYNELIKNKLNNEKKNNLFYLKLTSIRDDKPFFKPIFVDDSGDLPINWYNKISWNFLFIWGYIWNVLIILIGSVLSFFSSIFSSGSGYFFGNFGLGITLTTILIRTLLWPIYTKSNFLSTSMNTMKPEIDKIKSKYVLKKDKESLQKMQMEIAKVYKKHNLSVFSFFIPFLQMPIFIAMFRALARFSVSGGIFEYEKYTEKKFLGLINFNFYDSGWNLDTVIRIFLSLIVGSSMLYLNKLNAKKNLDSNKNVKILDEEEKLKKKNQDLTIKIVGYVMIFFMVLTSFKNTSLSLYWVVGNIYTIFQININLKKNDNKSILLKYKSIS
ncbi:preprotein translocase subunit [Candidatus Phytoplasma luffae]|uniref:Preprotein translocase subunit n=1 Tax=Loofah witches'-broom phytoplasma TaxID=35773 RepID=A0A975FJR9_LOWBP|nr:membrane protein insertase YidC [Candidatus Phytoplasma luffae]QTX03207.1 preprotein translocase subunit [Candidatus Phytoplasma luffae]